MATTRTRKSKTGRGAPACVCEHGAAMHGYDNRCTACECESYLPALP